MLRLLTPTILIILFTGFGFTQTNLDSLYTIWKDNSLSDSIRANSFHDYIQGGYFYTHPDSAILLTNQLIEFTKNSNYEIGSVDALNLAGYTYFRMGDYPKALESYRNGLAIAERINDKVGTANILLRTGFIYHDNEDIITALKYYERSLKIYEEIDDLDGVGSIYNEYGSIYRAKGEYDKSLEYYLKSIAINDQLNDEAGNSAMYINIGHLYIDEEDFTKALDYFQKGLSIYETNADQLGIASGLTGIGDVYSEQGNDAKALEYYQRSLSISERINDTQGTAATLLSIAIIFEDRKEYTRSIEHCKRSLMLAQKIGDIGNQEASYDCLYIAYKALGNVKEALKNHELMLQFADSLQSEETAIRLQQMEFSKQVLADSLAQVEKDTQLKMAHQIEVQQKDANRNLAIGAGIFFLLLSGGFFSRWRYVKKSKAIIEREKDRSENLLLNILPAEIAEELKEKGEAAARDFDLVSILFTDFKGFTEKSAELSAVELIDEVNQCFKAFDLICEKYGIEKIKTIGDAYMAAGGLPVPSNESVQNTVLAALEMQAYITDRIEKKKAKNEVTFEMRLGIHTGPVVAGIVGVKKFQYDVWGDTVNTASRMEDRGEIGKVNISQSTYELIMDSTKLTFQARGAIKVKGKGEMKMWFVEKSQ